MNESIRRRMAYWHPINSEGLAWNFVSFRGRVLGMVDRLFGRWVASKSCCNTIRHYDSVADAARYVQTSLYCTECKLSCLAPKSN